MVEFIPLRWTLPGGGGAGSQGPPTASFAATVRRGEHFTFQLAVYVRMCSCRGCLCVLDTITYLGIVYLVYCFSCIPDSQGEC